MTMSRLLLITSTILLALLVANTLWIFRPGQIAAAKQASAAEVELESAIGSWQLASLEPEQYALIFFGYHRCPDICPLTLAHLGRAYQQLPIDLQDRLQVVMVSVDPRLDDWQELFAYPPLFHPSFKAVAGETEQVDQLVAHFEAFYRVVDLPSSGLGYAIDHSPGLYLTNHRAERLLTLVSDDSHYLLTELKTFFGDQP